MTIAFARRTFPPDAALAAPPARPSRVLSMRIDHHLAGDTYGAPLTPEQRQRAGGVLESFGFTPTASGWALDPAYPWMSVEDSEGRLHVSVHEALPAHLHASAVFALDGLLREASLVPLDPLTRRVIDPADWARRLAPLRIEAAGRGPGDES